MPTLLRITEETATGDIIEAELIEVRVQVAEKLKQINPEGAR